MLERGDASARDIDTAMKLGAGYPMGPLQREGNCLSFRGSFDAIILSNCINLIASAYLHNTELSAQLNQDDVDEKYSTLQPRNSSSSLPGSV